LASTSTGFPRRVGVTSVHHQPVVAGEQHECSGDGLWTEEEKRA
jgi:hypothetical protein